MNKRKSLRDWQNELYKTFKDKGWDSIKRTPLENHALITSEVAEATECVRNGEPPVHYVNGKPEGEVFEIIDVIIRAFNYLSEMGEDVESRLIEKDKYNKTRLVMHGKKI